MEEHREAGVSAVAALDEPTRRRLYEHVVRQPDPVSRDDVAAAMEVPRATVAFHLDRLVQEGLLVVTYERRTGRTGPGAGRPAKLYRRSDREVTVNFPERRYDLAGQLLAGALEEAERTGDSPRAALNKYAYTFGQRIGSRAGDAGVINLLEAHGFEPRADGANIALANCPFHTLAIEHTEIVCDMNLRLLEGVLDGMGNPDLRARISLAPPNCCVRLERLS
jgi:predicted ArsR family transcriptional regulator